MALWQIGFFVLPKNCITDGSNFEISDEFGFDDGIIWDKFQINVNYFEDIGKILPRTKSWAKYLILYGDEDSNRFEIVSENDIVGSVSFRIDFTSDYQPILDGIIEFCILKGLIILDEQLNVVALNYELAKSVIANAPQVKKYNCLLKINKNGV